MIHTIPIQICQDCLNLKGDMCHNPECVFCRRTMVEVNQLLNDILVAPIIDGVRHVLYGDVVAV